MDTTNTPESPLLIAHLADTHLRDTQYGTSQRGTDFFAAFVRAVEAALTWRSKDGIGIDCIIHAGDLFDTSRPSPRVIGQLMLVDRQLRKRGIPMLCVTGNHDYTSPTWLETLFPGDIDGGGVVPIDNRTVEIRGYTIGGVAPYGPNMFRAKQEEIQELAEKCDVLAYHGFVTGIVPVFAGAKNVLCVDELPTKPAKLKFLPLGDIHVQGYVTQDGTMVGYPGSTEMCSSSESIDKSIPIVRVNQDGAGVFDRVKLKIRPYITAKVRTEAELDALMEKVLPAATTFPVVVVDFDRDLTQTLTRLYGALDAQRCVIRCSVLPSEKLFNVRATDAPGAERFESLTMEHFISRSFDDDVPLGELALGLYHRGEDGAASLIADFIEQVKIDKDVREF